MTTLLTTNTTMKQLDDVVTYQESNCTDHLVRLGSIKYLDINTLGVDGVETHATDWSMSQICQMEGIPYTYMKNCNTLNPELAKRNFREWNLKNFDKKVLVRTYQNDIVGILSDKYTIFDNDKVMELIDSTDLANYKVVGHTISPERLTVRVREEQPFLDDLFCGVQVENSQVGRHPLSIKFMIYKQVCTNGLMVSKFDSDVLSKKHIGNFLVNMGGVRESLSGIDEYRGLVKRAVSDSMQDNLKSLELDRLLKTLVDKRYITQPHVDSGYMDSLLDKYGRTRWGFVNILTELSQQFTLDKRLEIETYAGRLLA